MLPSSLKLTMRFTLASMTLRIQGSYAPLFIEATAVNVRLDACFISVGSAPLVRRKLRV